MKLKDARIKAGLTQVQLVAELNARGLSTVQSTLSHWERIGRINPHALAVLSDILGVSVESRPTPMILRAISLLENEGYIVTKG